MTRLFQNSFANVRKIIAPSIVCMLLLAVVSCENSNELFDDRDIFAEEFFSEDIFTRDFFVRYDIFYNNCGWVLDGNLTLSYAGSPQSWWIKPTYLPKELQKCGRLVNVTYRTHTMGGRKCNIPVVKIVAIKEAVFTSRFIVRKFDDCGWLLFEDLEDVDNLLVVKPINLPEDYQKENIRVIATFHQRWHGYLTNAVPCEDVYAAPIYITHIVEVSEKISSTQTRITGGFPINITVAPWQVLLSRNGDLCCGGSIIAPNFILTAPSLPRDCIV